MGIVLETVKEVRFVRLLVVFEFKNRFLLSQYPPGITRIESQFLIIKHNFVVSKVTYLTVS